MNSKWVRSAVGGQGGDKPHPDNTRMHHRLEPLAWYCRGEACPHPGLPRRLANLRLIVCALLLLCTLGSTFLISYQAFRAYYRRDTSLANDGVQHFQKAETLLKNMTQHPFDAGSIDTAGREFNLAQSDFARLETDIQAIPTFSTHLPLYGGELQAAFALIPAAFDASHAGTISCTLLKLLLTRFQNPLSSSGQGVTSDDMTVIDRGAQQVVADLSQALDQLQQVQPNTVRFNAKLSKLVETVQAEMPTLRRWLGNIQQLLPSLPTLLGIGTPTNYLIEVLDSSELRPGGGFIGNYGIATLSGGRLASAHITDIDLLDRPFEAKGGTIPVPSAYSWFPLAQNWSFRDSNLDADFPTAARYGEQNYQREGGNLPVQGVIAITPMLIQQAVAITGPIYIPEYQETITPQNIIARIHYYQLGAGARGPDTIASPDGHSSLRKRFTELLAEHFLARVHQLSSAALPQLLQVLLAGLRTKDLQIYFNASAAEALLHLTHLDATIAAPTGDSLMVVDANVSPNKANSFMHYTLNDQVTIDEQGNATHHTTLTYVWDIPGTAYGQSVYRDYVRIYIPPTSILLQEDGPASKGMGSAFGRKVLSGFLSFSFGQTRTITLNWRVPSAAKKDADGWHYQYELQRQAGILWQLHEQVTLPMHATLTSLQGGLIRASAQQAGMTGPLNEDASLAASYL